MNKENLQKVIDHISKHSSEFDMNFEISTPVHCQQNGDLIDPNICGTACCILGWTNVIGKNFKPMKYDDFRDIDFAAEFLELRKDFVHAICYPGTTGTPYGTTWESNRLQPWREADDKGIIDITSFPDECCYYAPASAAIAVLEAIRDEVIFVPKSEENVKD
jgi:hypothetical protein